jgi:hypothetical protein
MEMSDLVAMLDAANPPSAKRGLYGKKVVQHKGAASAESFAGRSCAEGFGT